MKTIKLSVKIVCLSVVKIVAKRAELILCRIFGDELASESRAGS